MEKEMEELKGLKVLIVDDDVDLADTLKDQIESVGMRVVGVTGEPEEAKRMAEEGNPDLIIMDIKLPGTDGISLAEEINVEDPKPVLFLSAYSDRSLIMRAKDAGALTYLVKPVTLNKIVPSIILTMERFREITKLRAYVDSMKEDLENNRAIEWARELLVKREGISEHEATERMREKSHGENRPLADVAREILASTEVK